MAEHRLPLDLSVPNGLWEAVATATRPQFADSYLSRAKVRGTTITPHTALAHDRIRQNGWAMKAIADSGFTLVKPLHFGHPDRPDTFNPYAMAAE